MKLIENVGKIFAEYQKISTIFAAAGVVLPEETAVNGLYLVQLDKMKQDGWSLEINMYVGFTLGVEGTMPTPMMDLRLQFEKPDSNRLLNLLASPNIFLTFSSDHYYEKWSGMMSSYLLTSKGEEAKARWESKYLPKDWQTTGINHPFISAIAHFVAGTTSSSN